VAESQTTEKLLGFVLIFSLVGTLFSCSRIWHEKYSKPIVVTWTGGHFLAEQA